MTAATAKYQLTINSSEAKGGAKRILVRKGKQLEVNIPAGVKTGSLIKLNNALQITDGCGGNIHVSEL